MELPVIGNSTAAPSGGCSAKSCGSTGGHTGELPEHLRLRVADHPCYSEEAHHHFARMHVAVAPACNIQCHYCNRKYDCANESRPGVVSELYTPDQAAKKVLAVAAAIPQLSVLGIAGPGDPLANPQRTFETFRKVAEHAPDIKLCVSTNGLNLPQYVDELQKYNIDHVTITINCVDPEIGAKIYPWIFWKHKRLFGREAAAILIEQQQRGLELLTARGILVKVNSVMIPGINDQHLREVSRIVKAKGAFLHNVMPLIADAAHGTYFGLSGQRAPTADELQSLQDDCADADMKMMRHCRQCRADAVGMLGEDRGAEFSLEKVEAMEVDYVAAMERRAQARAEISAKIEAKRSGHAEPQVSVVTVAKSALHKATQESAQSAPTRPVKMAVASSGGGVINEHFGHAREFLIYEASAEAVRLLGHRKTDLYCGGASTCGEADDVTESVLANTIRALQGCEVVLCSRIGFEPWGMLESAGIQPNGEHAMEVIEDAIRVVYAEMAAAGRLDQLHRDVRLSA